MEISHTARGEFKIEVLNLGLRALGVEGNLSHYHSVCMEHLAFEEVQIFVHVTPQRQWPNMQAVTYLDLGKVVESILTECF